MLRSSGNLRGLLIRTTLLRPDSPLAITTDDLLTPKVLARNLIKCVLAFPSIGGAVMRILTLLLCRPTISSREDFG